VGCAATTQRYAVTGPTHRRQQRRQQLSHPTWLQPGCPAGGGHQQRPMRRQSLAPASPSTNHHHQQQMQTQRPWQARPSRDRPMQRQRKQQQTHLHDKSERPVRVGAVQEYIRFACISMLTGQHAGCAAPSESQA
jgi:hypothetical protein